MAIDVIELYPAAVQAVLIDGWEDLFGQLQRHINSNAFFALGRIRDADVQPPVMARHRRNLAGTGFGSVWALAASGKNIIVVSNEAAKLTPAFSIILEAVVVIKAILLTHRNSMASRPRSSVRAGTRVDIRGRL